MPRPDDTVTLQVNQKEMTGWEAVRISRSLDRMPSDFDVAMSDRTPTNPAVLAIEAGMSCTVKIGKDIIMQGWIDRVAPSFSPRGHTIRIMGRSLCADLVDCSVTPDILTGGQIMTSSLLDLATKLATPFKIPVAVTSGVGVALAAPGGVPLQFNAILTETPWEVMERVARFLGVLIYDMPDGSLMIANVGSATHASGFAQGQNVQDGGVSYAMDARYSQYLPCLMGTNLFGQQGVGGMTFPVVRDDGVTRFRPLVVVSEQFQYGQPQAEVRAKWEMARRFGRSQAVHLTCDSWRDKDGVLWAPNAFAPVNLPALKLTTPPKPWVIGSVSFTKDADRGTVADIVMMPREAFQPEPSILQPFLYDPSTMPPAQDGVA